MALEPIKCGAALVDGSQCNELAAVTKTRYVYNSKPQADGPTQYVLREIHYEALCPICGERTLIEEHGGSPA
jgi:hypothetical protein